MEPLITKILAQVDQAGGRIAYRAVYDSLEANERPLLPRAMKQLKAEGTAMNQNRVDANGNRVFEIFRLPGQGSG